MINYINYSINELLVTQGNEVLNLENIYKGFNYNKINHKEIINNNYELIYFTKKLFFNRISDNFYKSYNVYHKFKLIDLRKIKLNMFFNLNNINNLSIQYNINSNKILLNSFKFNDNNTLSNLLINNEYKEDYINNYTTSSLNDYYINNLNKSVSSNINNNDLLIKNYYKNFLNQKSFNLKKNFLIKEKNEEGYFIFSKSPLNHVKISFFINKKEIFTFKKFYLIKFQINNINFFSEKRLPIFDLKEIILNNNNQNYNPIIDYLIKNENIKNDLNFNIKFFNLIYDYNFVDLCIYINLFNSQNIIKNDLNFINNNINILQKEIKYSLINEEIFEICNYLNEHENEIQNIKKFQNFNINNLDNKKEIITFLTNYKGNYTGFYNRLFLLVTINQILLNINNE